MAENRPDVVVDESFHSGPFDFSRHMISRFLGRGKPAVIGQGRWGMQGTIGF